MILRRIALVVCAVVLVPAAVLADEVGPEVEVCQGKSPDEACVLPQGTRGTCRPGFRNRLTCLPAAPAGPSVSSTDSANHTRGCHAAPSSEVSATLGATALIAAGLAATTRRRRT